MQGRLIIWKYCVCQILNSISFRIWSIFLQFWTIFFRFWTIWPTWIVGWVHWLSARAGLAASLSLRIGFCGKISHIFELDWTFEIYLSQRPDKEDDRTFLIHPHYWKVLWFPYAYVIVVLRLMITIWCTYQPYWKTHISLFTIWPSDTQLLFNDWNLGGMSSKDWGRRGKGQIWNSIPLKFKSSPYLPLLWTWARNLTSRWQNRQKWATQVCPTVAQCPRKRRRVKAFTKQSSTTLTPPFPVELPLRFPSHQALARKEFDQTQMTFDQTQVNLCRGCSCWDGFPRSGGGNYRAQHWVCYSHFQRFFLDVLRFTKVSLGAQRQMHP